jgi:peptide/nickel transport system ATP-binding protein
MPTIATNGTGPQAAEQDDVLLEVKDLKTYFHLSRGVVRAVDGISFEVRRGRTLGVLGESGCGKSVSAYSIMRLVRPPGRIEAGQVLLHTRRDASGKGEDGVLDLTALDAHGTRMRAVRGGEIGIVFQEPMTFLNPVYTVGAQINEAIILHQRVTKDRAQKIAVEMLRRVRLPDPQRVFDRYPHQLSGGQRQRALIAMALCCHPSLLIADEPTTALDVTTQAQILELMRDLQHEFGMAILYITHNLGVVAHMADEVVVMYLGQVVERTDVGTLFRDPKHPYTQALLSSIPKLGARSRSRLQAIPGVVPDPLNVPRGCRFHNRCASFMPGICDTHEPAIRDVENGHLVRCLLYEDQHGGVHPDPVRRSAS